MTSLEKSYTHFEKQLGASIIPRSINLWIDRKYDQTTEKWPWKLTPQDFGVTTRRQTCIVNSVPGFIIFVECPAIIYKEHDDGSRYRDGEESDKTMLEILCVEEIDKVRYDETVKLEVDLDLIGQWSWGN